MTGAIWRYVWLCFDEDQTAKIKQGESRNLKRESRLMKRCRGRLQNGMNVVVKRVEEERGRSRTMSEVAGYQERK